MICIPFPGTIKLAANVTDPLFLELISSAGLQANNDYLHWWSDNKAISFLQYWFMSLYFIWDETGFCWNQVSIHPL